MTKEDIKIEMKKIASRIWKLDTKNPFGLKHTLSEYQKLDNLVKELHIIELAETKASRHLKLV
jgi:hypothetical protein